MAATGESNPRGGDKSVHMKARMWDRLMTDAALHLGLRSITFGDGTLIVYDPALTPQEADGALPEWLTGHPAVTEYPLKPAHAHPGPADPRGTRVHRLPGTYTTEAQGYDPISMRPITKERRRGEGTPYDIDADLIRAGLDEVPRSALSCGWDNECTGQTRVYRCTIGGNNAIAYLCDDHAGAAKTFARLTGGSVEADQVGPGR